jgi:hypothetical protein
VIPNGEGIERTSAPRGKATRRAEPGIGQILRQSQGFRGYYVCDAGDGVCISVSLFDDRDSATAANEKAFNWIRASLVDLVQGEPEIIAGEIMQEGRGIGHEPGSASLAYPARRCSPRWRAVFGQIH